MHQRMAKTGHSYLLAKKDFASADYDTSKTASGKLWIKGLAVDTSGNESDPFTCQYEIDNEVRLRSD